MKIVGLLGAKKESQRLPNKAKLDFHGKPMFEWNVIKGVSVFDEFYVSSDCDEILARAKELGAIPIKRPTGELTEAPNIMWYNWCLQFMNEPDAIVAVQINSPTVSEELIRDAKVMLLSGFQEVMTVYPFADAPNYPPNYHNKAAKIYGSVWGMTVDRLLNYKDPYNPEPDVLLFDNSTDIHTEEDLQKARKEYNQTK